MTRKNAAAATAAFIMVIVTALAASVVSAQQLQQQQFPPAVTTELGYVLSATKFKIYWTNNFQDITDPTGLTPATYFYRVNVQDFNGNSYHYILGADSTYFFTAHAEPQTTYKVWVEVVDSVSGIAPFLLGGEPLYFETLKQDYAMPGIDVYVGLSVAEVHWTSGAGAVIPGLAGAKIEITIDTTTLQMADNASFYRYQYDSTRLNPFRDSVSVFWKNPASGITLAGLGPLEFDTIPGYVPFDDYSEISYLVGPTSFQVFWEPAELYDDDFITGFVVHITAPSEDSNPESAQHLVFGNDTFSCTYSNMISDSTYRVAVTVNYNSGKQEIIGPIALFTRSTSLVNDRVTVSIGANHFQASWEEYLGALSYQLTLDDDTFSLSANSHSMVLDSDGDYHTLSVGAVTSNGVVSLGTVSFQDLPYEIEALVGSNEVFLDWELGQDQGSTVSTYVVSIYDVIGVVQVNTSATEIWFTTAVAGGSYRFKVEAYDTDGSLVATLGPLSLKTLRIPFLTTNAKAVVSQSAFMVQWSDPSYNSSYCYNVYIGNELHGSCVNESRYYYDDAQQGNRYQVTVVCFNPFTSLVQDIAAITLYTSEDSDEVIDNDMDVGDAGSLSYVVGATSFYVFWDLNGRENDVSGYLLRIFAKGTKKEFKYELEADEAGFEFSSATPGSSFIVNLQIDYNVYASESIGPVVLTTSKQDAFRDDVGYALVGTYSFLVRWDLSTLGLSSSQLNSYKLVINNNAKTAVTVSANQTQYLNSESTPGQHYEVQLVGQFLNSSVLTLETFVFDTLEERLNYVVGANSIEIFWDIGDLTSSVNNYFVMIEAPDQTVIYSNALEASVTSFLFDHAHPSTTYQVSVSADLDSGASITLGPIAVTTLFTDMATTRLTVLDGYDRFHLFWEVDQPHVDMSLVTGFRISVNNETYVVGPDQRDYLYVDPDAIDGEYVIAVRALRSDDHWVFIGTIRIRTLGYQTRYSSNKIDTSFDYVVGYDQFKIYWNAFYIATQTYHYYVEIGKAGGKTTVFDLAYGEKELLFGLAEPNTVYFTKVSAALDNGEIIELGHSFITTLNAPIGNGNVNILIGRTIAEIFWEPVEMAVSYSVFIDNKEQVLSNSTYSLFRQLYNLGSKHEIVVVATLGGNKVQELERVNIRLLANDDQFHVSNDYLDYVVSDKVIETFWDVENIVKVDSFTLEIETGGHKETFDLDESQLSHTFDKAVPDTVYTLTMYVNYDDGTYITLGPLKTKTLDAPYISGGLEALVGTDQFELRWGRVANASGFRVEAGEKQTRVSGGEDSVVLSCSEGETISATVTAEMTDNTDQSLGSVSFSCFVAGNLVSKSDGTGDDKEFAWVSGAKEFILYWDLPNADDVESIHFTGQDTTTLKIISTKLFPNAKMFHYTEANPKSRYVITVDIQYKNHTEKLLGPFEIKTLATSLDAGEFDALLGPDRILVRWQSPTQYTRGEVSGFIVGFDNIPYSVAPNVHEFMIHTSFDTVHAVRMIAIIGNSYAYFMGTKQPGQVIPSLSIPSPAEAFADSHVPSPSPGITVIQVVRRYNYLAIGLGLGFVTCFGVGFIGYFAYKKRHAVVNFNKMTVASVVATNPSRAVEAHKLLELDDL